MDQVLKNMHSLTIPQEILLTKFLIKAPIPIDILIQIYWVS